MSRPFREHSVYVVTCRCGAELEAASTEVTCAKCGAVAVIQWAPEVSAQAPK
jgi:hypothetical protein